MGDHEYPKTFGWEIIGQALTKGFKLEAIDKNKFMLVARKGHEAHTYAGIWRNYLLDGQIILVPNWFTRYVDC